jgi:hypothetical protein
VSEPAEDDVTRRTRLAAERTWLAWWRSGIAAEGAPERVTACYGRSAAKRADVSSAMTAARWSNPAMLPRG